MTNSCIYNGKVIHKRFKPKEHYFKYSVFSLLLDLSELKKIDQEIGFFSLNKFNLISFHEKDHGERDGSSLEEWVKKNLEQNRIETVNIKIKLLCYPRIFGYVFNPLSIFFVYNHNDKLISILYEVKNTFGDQVHYLTLNKFKDKEFKKNMYVSPFIEMDCIYKISSKNKRKNHFFCNINQFNLKKEQIFYASIDLNLKEITFYNFILFLILNIFGSVKTITLIHYQAIKLFLKKSKFFKYSNRIKDNLYLD